MPDEVMVAIAATVATRAADALVSAAQNAVTRLVRAVRDRLGHDRTDLETFDAAVAAPTNADRVHALGEAISRVSQSDPAFATYLRALWEQAAQELTVDHGGVVNQINGTVSGQVIQARDIHGDVTFG